MNNEKYCIAGSKTPEDWRLLKQRLIENSCEETWKEALDDYFLKRLNLRYLNPIKVLRKHGTSSGEGFSILAILCTLIEFLESTVKGFNYRYLKNGEKLGEFEYSKSSKLFKDFLCNREPFNKEFDSELATNFYINIRCGLLHEAQTKNRWRIRAKNKKGKMIDKDQKLVYRDSFMEAISSFIDIYCIELKSNKKFQEAFIRKYDSLCE
jgi:hypothetical protein